MEQTPSPPLDSTEAAAYLKISRRSLHKLVQDGAIAHHRAGPKLLRFAIADLDAFLARRRTEAST